MKTPPAAVLLMKALGLEKGSSEPNKSKIVKISINKVREIAELKFDDLNASNIDSAMDMICGTARSMGIEVENN